MAFRNDANSEWLVRTSSVINYNAAYTLMGWVRPALINSAFHGIFTITAADSNLNADGCYINSSNRWTGYSYNAGVASGNTDNGSVVQDTWYHVALVRSSTSVFQLYINGVQSGGNTTTNVAARASSDGMRAGGYPWNVSQYLNGRMGNIKAWTAALSVAEIQNEMRTVRPQRMANLWGWWPVFNHTDLVDYSGNGRAWTASGTLTTEDGPPVSWGHRGYMMPSIVSASSSDPRTIYGANPFGYTLDAEGCIDGWAMLVRDVTP